MLLFNYSQWDYRDEKLKEKSERCDVIKYVMQRRK